MGTLTAGQPRLAEYCLHKLPTSCRLSSIPNCCACADERAHAAEYRTYIDGVGFVPRGNRWQRYCWFCKEFWGNRVEASGLRPAQTRIPETPDQTEFLERWYEFWQGYRVTGQDEQGNERRQAVVGEELKEVSPGKLPRTVEEMRAGRERSEADRQTRAPQVEAREEVVGPTLESTLDQLFQEAETEENQPQTSSQAQATTAPVELDSRAIALPSVLDRRNDVHGQAMPPAVARNRDYQARRIAALRRELHRMRNGIERVISGLRDLGEEVPGHTETTSRLSTLSDALGSMHNDASVSIPSREDADRMISSVNALSVQGGSVRQDQTLARMQGRIDEARQHFDEARRARDQVANELELADQELRTSQERLQQLQREQRTTENYMRVFGTRQEFLAAGEDYESPIGGMFTRAWERFRAAEEVRREERTLRQILDDETAAGGENHARRLSELEGMQYDVWGVPRASDHASVVGGAWQPPALQRQDVIAMDTEEGYEILEELYEEIREDAEELEAETGTDQALEEYYSMLRRQNWSQQARTGPSEATSERANFPQSMLNAVVETRELDDRALRSTSQHQNRRPDENALQALSNFSDERGPELFVLKMILSAPASQDTNEARDFVDPYWTDADNLRRLGSALHEDEGNVASEIVARADEDLRNNEDLMFLARLPQRRVANGSGNGASLSFLRMREAEAHMTTAATRMWNIEAMAQAYMLSHQVRVGADLSPPERLQTLYRLQAGERVRADRAILAGMCTDRTVLDDAEAALQRNTANVGSSLRLDEVRQAREAANRVGNPISREPDTNFRPTNAFALAAGRQAMQSSPQSLMQRITRDSDEMRRLLEAGSSRASPGGSMRVRLPNSIIQRNDREDSHRHRFSHSRWAGRNGIESPSPSSSRSSSPAGLDAKDTGRPEPKSDEEMTMKLDCKICYTQMAEIACLPCGHLVMCQWCSEQHSPVMGHDRTRPRRLANCPVCRKGIRQKVRVFRA